MKAEQWSRSLQVIATQLQLCHCVDCMRRSMSHSSVWVIAWLSWYRRHEQEVCVPFRAKNFTEGPSGVLASQKYKSCFFRASKNTTLPQPCITEKSESRIWH